MREENDDGEQAFSTQGKSKQTQQKREGKEVGILKIPLMCEPCCRCNVC